MKKEQILKLLDDPTRNAETQLLREFLQKTPAEQETIHAEMWNKPNLTVEEVLIMEYMRKPTQVGKYGQMWLNYMEENKLARKTFLLTEGLLQETAMQVQQEALDMKTTLEEQYKQKHPRPTEDWLAIYQYEQEMANVTEEIVLNEIVYKAR